MIECNYCGLVFADGDRITLENAYILHVMRKHKNDTPKEKDCWDRMYIVGIIGSSKADKKEHFDFIEKLIVELLKKQEDTLIVTGDANGVDLAVRLICLKNRLKHSVIYARFDSWAFYKMRNEIIANYCDRIISIALPLDKTPCYHCNSNTHDKTAGCYTGKLNGNYEVIIIPHNNKKKVGIEWV